MDLVCAARGAIYLPVVGFLEVSFDPAAESSAFGISRRYGT
jgi:hypothetical protein